MDTLKSQSIEPEKAASHPYVGVFWLICVGVWLHAADTLVTATLAPSIADELGGVAYINWTISL